MTKINKTYKQGDEFTSDSVNEIIAAVNKNADDAETKANASATYETKANASSTYETKANASSTYETKANASSTYETKANASAAYVSKAEAVGYDDILTNANASTTYETKTHATETYATKTQLNSKANASDLGTQCTFVLNGTTLTITSK